MSRKRAAPLLFDLVASNPPYIGRREAPTLAREVREYEPAHALFGGEEGYELYADLIAQAATVNPGGILVVELGHDSLPAVQPLLDAASWTAVGVTNDLAGIPRVIAADANVKSNGMQSRQPTRDLESFTGTLFAMCTTPS